MDLDGFDKHKCPIDSGNNPLIFSARSEDISRASSVFLNSGDCPKLRSYQRVTVEYDVKDQQEVRRCQLRICSRREPEQSMIYHRLGLSAAPLGRRMYTAK
jgi:hypothetical protein